MMSAHGSQNSRRGVELQRCRTVALANNRKQYIKKLQEEKLRKERKGQRKSKLERKRIQENEAKKKSLLVSTDLFMSIGKLKMIELLESQSK